MNYTPTRTQMARYWLWKIRTDGPGAVLDVVLGAAGFAAMVGVALIGLAVIAMLRP